MDSPQSDDERLQQAGAEETLLSKKMKLLILMLSLVLIILLLPIATNHGLPLLKPMGTSMLQRLWDAMRFIAMTAAISVGIISTSSQRNDKGFDRSAHLRSTSSTHRSSTPIASSSRESINPNMINHLDMNRSDPPNLSVGRGTNDMLHQESGGKERANSRKAKGKELMDDDFSPAASSTDAFSYASREEAMYGLGTPSKHVRSGGAPSLQSNHENLKQRPTNSRRRLSASDAWFLASRIDEEIEEEGNIANATLGLSPDKYIEASRVESQRISSPTDDKGLLIRDKEIKTSAERGFMNVYASMTDDSYAELRMRKAAILRLADDTHDATGKGHRRSSSVDRRRPIHYDDQGPDRPGLKQILMDVSKERALNGKLSNLPSANKRLENVNEQRDRPRSAQSSISSTPNTTSTPSTQQSRLAGARHHSSIKTLPSDNLNQNVKHSDADGMRSNQVIHYKQQEAMKMGSNQILQQQADNAKMGPNEMVQSKQLETPNQLRKGQDDATKRPNQRMQTEVRSDQIVQKQNYHQAKVGINQTLHKQADAKIAFAHGTLQKAEARMGSDLISQMHPHGAAKAGSIVSEGVLQTQRRSNNAKGSARIMQTGDQNQEDFQPTNFQRPTNLSSRSKLLIQSSKHSRSALNLEQLEQAVSNTLHAKPPAGSSVKRKKSFSCDFGDGFTPDWLWELEPPPPPGFIDQQSVMTSPTEANQLSSDLSTYQPAFIDESSSTLVQNLVPWRSSVPIDISAYPARAASPISPSDVFSHSTNPSPGEVNRRADEFISNFNTNLFRQRQESLERHRRHG